MDPIVNQSFNVDKKESFFKKYFLFYLFLILLIVAFWGGAKFGENRNQVEQTKKVTGGQVLNTDQALPDYLSKDVDFSLFWDVWRAAKQNYIKKDTPDTKLFYGALSGMVASLGDPYSTFFDPDTYKKFNEEMQGSFDGIGAEVGLKKGQLVIIAPLPGTPAEKVGLRPGDKILAIDKTDTTGIALDYAVSLIRGKKGTEVTLTILRDGSNEDKKIKITRDKIVVKSVTWSMKSDNIAYIKVSHFNDDTETGFKQAVQEALTKNPKGLILDLRSNPGGYLDTAVNMVGYWVGDQVAVIEKYNDGKEDTYKASGIAKLKDVKTVVLVNQGSASASEIVAGALQDYQKATLVGKKTFGKGSVQDLRPLKGGSAIKLTIAKWLTPKGRSINEEGIKPDIEVDLTDADFNNNKDPQLDKAFEQFKK